MNLKILKLFVIAAVFTFAACALLFSNNKMQAQSGKSSEKRDEVLEKVANYKVWKQVQKPAPTTEKDSTEPLTIANSSAGG